MRVDALRSLNRWDDVLAAVESYLGQFTERPAPRRGALQEGRGDGEGASRHGREVASQEGQHEVITLYRRVWAEAPLEAWGERAGERLEQIAAALPSAEAAVVRTRSAAELVTRGMIYFDHNRNDESESAFASALGAPGLDADYECRARFYRAQSVWKQRQRPRAAPLFDEADGSARGPATATSTRRRSTRGRAATPRPGTATPRWRATRASRPSTPTTATPTTRGCGWRSWRPTPVTRRRPPRSWPRCRRAIRRATC